MNEDQIEAAAKYLVEIVERKLWNGISSYGRAKDNGYEPFHSSQFSWEVNMNARQEDYKDVIRGIIRLLSVSKEEKQQKITTPNICQPNKLDSVHPSSLPSGESDSVVTQDYAESDTLTEEKNEEFLCNCPPGARLNCFDPRCPYYVYYDPTGSRSMRF